MLSVPEPDMFQTLKGSLQTVEWDNWSNCSRTCFKPSKDRYKQEVINKIRDAIEFQTLKGSLQTETVHVIDS